MTFSYTNSIPLAIAPSEIIVDNFAGGGGASLGIGMALGRSPDIAINHDAEAIAMHAANHPETKHYCEDVWHVDPIEACAGRPVGLAWFSPDCKHFSKAKGGKPVSKKIRGLAWVVIRWAKAVKPRVIILENVEEFKDWGPVMADNLPCPLRKGQTFRRWKSQLENLGYRVEHRELRASDYGSPTIRKRLFLVARCDGLPIHWPEPTHGDPKKINQDLFTTHLKPWRTAAECIDWSLPCPSIFERNRPLAENTLRRIAAGIRRFVIEANEPFIVNLTHHGSDRVESLDEPFRTVTGANRGEKALVTPYVVNMAHGGKIEDMERPISTIATEKGGCRALVTPFLAGVGGRAGQSPERSPNQPYQTITAKADGAIICPTLIQTGYGERPAVFRCIPCGENFTDQHASEVDGLSPAECPICGEEEKIELRREAQSPRVPGLDKPLGTVVAGAAKHALLSAVLVGTGGPSYSAKPRSADQPIHTMTTNSRAAVVSAFLAQHNSERGNGVKAGRKATEPFSTITSSGSHQQVVTSHLLKLFGTCQDGQPVTEPIGTIRAQGTHFGEVRAFLIKYFGTDQDPRLEEPLHTVTSKDRFGLVTVRGEEYVIVDIGLRMLSPPELYRAQGFPEDYLTAPTINGKRLSKTAQVRMCGNSVCPPIAAAVARAQFVASPAARAA